MDKTQCNDKSGTSHFGEYGWYDGYVSSVRNCRVELKMRGTCCSDSDDCADACQKKIRDSKSRNDIVSQNIRNMIDGEKKKQLEEKEEKEMAAKRREEEKKKLEESKKKDAAEKEGKIICDACKEAVDVKAQPEVKQGICACPACGKKINSKTGELIVGMETEEKKEEPKKEEPKAEEPKKEEPKAEDATPETKPEPDKTEPAPAVGDKPKDESSPKEETTPAK